jgi:hypothetical protein
MIVVFYRWRLKQGRRAEFEVAWAEVTAALRARGSGGSALFVAQDGTMVGVARWPSLDLRDELFAANLTPEASSVLRDCIEETLQSIEMSEVRNLWAFEFGNLND